MYICLCVVTHSSDRDETLVSCFAHGRFLMRKCRQTIETILHYLSLLSEHNLFINLLLQMPFNQAILPAHALHARHSAHNLSQSRGQPPGHKLTVTF